VKGIVETILGGASEGGWKLQKIHKSYLTPSTAREFVVGAERLAFLGAVSPEVCARWDLKGSAYYAEISLDKVAGKAGNVVKKFREWPRYPAVARDLSLTVKDEVPCEALIKEICELGGGLIRSVSLFDLFRGKRIPAGYKNLAFRMVYQSLERTLVSEEVQKLHDRIADTLVRKYQAAFQQ
jgi:phenylalanyl-tRNA synthetase beta chain